MFSAGSAAKPRNLLLTVDAFGTLFKPRKPIGVQYGEVARRHGLSGFNDDEIQSSFREAFKAETSIHPGYGKLANMTPPQWWSNVINNTFNPFTKDQPLPRRLITDLLTRFSSSEGYELFPDVMPFFEFLRRVKHSRASSEWHFDYTVVGVVTNSDDRVPSILRSLGLQLNPRRIDNDQEPSPITKSSDDIDFLALSYDIGVPKPDRRIWDAVKNTVKRIDPLAGDRSYNSWHAHIGDSLEEDVLGAKMAGWVGMLIDREGLHDELFAKSGPFATFETGRTTQAGKPMKAQVLQELGALRYWDPDSGNAARSSYR